MFAYTRINGVEKKMTKAGNETPLAPHELLSLKKVKFPKVPRDEVEPGEYEVDFLVRVQGSIRVGEDYEARQPQKANPWKLLRVALSKLNSATVDTIVQEALSGKYDDDDSWVKDQAKEAIARLTEDTVVKKRGPVTGSVHVEGVGMEMRARELKAINACTGLFATLSAKEAVRRSAVTYNVWEAGRALAAQRVQVELETTLDDDSDENQAA